MTVYARIGANGGPSDDGIVSDWVKRLDLWHEIFTVGRWAVTLDNITNRLWGKFVPNEDCEFKIDNASLMKGYVDDSLPQGLPYEIEQELMIVEGRHYARKLVDLFHTISYANGLTKVEDIISEVITAMGGDIDITFAKPGLTAAEAYEFDRTFLQDGFRDICLPNDYLFYVDDAKALQLFLDVNAPSSGVTLKSVAGAIDNNVLDVKPIGEKRGFGIRNYIHVKGPLVDDHWSEGNASDFSETQNCTVSNETTIYVRGRSSIKATITNTAAEQFFLLPFPIYDYDSLDFSEEGSVDCFVMLRQDMGTVSIGIHLVDDASPANQIRFTSPLLLADTWYKVIFPVGVNNDIEPVPEYGAWSWVVQNSAFTWNIKKIGIRTLFTTMGKNVYLDRLNIPLNALSIVDATAGEISNYGKRMLPLSKLDASSQIELDAYAADVKAKHKDPLETLNATIIGNTSLHYAGQTVIVNIPGISSVTYRIQKLHHVFMDNAWKNLKHITVLELVKQTL